MFFFGSATNDLAFARDVILLMAGFISLLVTTWALWHLAHLVIDVVRDRRRTVK